MKERFTRAEERRATAKAFARAEERRATAKAIARAEERRATAKAFARAEDRRGTAKFAKSEERRGNLGVVLEDRRGVVAYRSGSEDRKATLRFVKGDGHVKHGSLEELEQDAEESRAQLGGGDLSDLPEEAAPRHWTSRFVLTESNAFRMVWNVLLALLLVYTGTIFPYRLCFVDLNVSGKGSDSEAWAAIEDVVDILFYFDLVVNFLFSFRDDEGTEVTSMCAIGSRYLRGYFTPNLIACFPPELVQVILDEIVDTSGETGDSSSVNKSARITRLQRISRLARLVRLARLGKLANFVLENPVWTLLQSIRGVRIVNFVFGLFWAVHLVACGWYIVAFIQYASEGVENTWVARRDLLEAGPLEQWFHANYFVLTVFTTVGFGDISAFTVGEIAYVCFTMIVGAMVHSIIMSEVINIVMSVDQAAQDLAKQKELVRGFGRHTEMTKGSLDAMLKFFNKSRTRRLAFDRTRMRSLITGSAMPRELMGELIHGVFGGSLEQNSFITTCLRHLKRMPPRFPLLVALAVHQRHLLCKELVYSAYDHPWTLFLTVRGTFAHIAFPSRSGGVADLPPEFIEEDREELPLGPASSAPQRATTTSTMEKVRSLVVPVKMRTVSTASHKRPKSLDDRPVLAPYQLMGPRTYFGEAELMLTPGHPRRATARCESEEGGTLLVLHCTDLEQLCNDFPTFAIAWKAAAKRREERRLLRLLRLTQGSRGYRHLAAHIIQRVARAKWFGHKDVTADRARQLQEATLLRSKSKSMLAKKRANDHELATPAHFEALREELMETVVGVREDMTESLDAKCSVPIIVSHFDKIIVSL